MSGAGSDSQTAPASQENRTEPPDAPSVVPTSRVVSFELGSHRLNVLPVDGVVPEHRQSRGGARARLAYVPGEIAHFELAGHRYALVREESPGEETPFGDPAAATAHLGSMLTNRELQIVQLISMGCLTKQVSDRLRISEFTVRSYLKTIYCKLGVRSRGALVFRYAQSFRPGNDPQ